MKLIMPKNIFSSIFLSSLGKDHLFEISFRESSLITKYLEANTSAVALIPTLDLINHRHLFVSSKFALSFDGVLSNSYFYFVEGEKSIEKVFLHGDVSVNEIILAKILFSEKFSANVEFILNVNKNIEKEKDYFVTGDENFRSLNFEKGISFADEVADLLELPYVNFVFASPNSEALEKFNELVKEINSKIEDKIESILELLPFPEETKSFISNNIGQVYFDMTDNEVTAVNELIKLVYYHGIIDDIFDVKFV